MPLIKSIKQEEKEEKEAQAKPQGVLITPMKATSSGVPLISFEEAEIFDEDVGSDDEDEENLDLND